MFPIHRGNNSKDYSAIDLVILLNINLFTSSSIKGFNTRNCVMKTVRLFPFSPGELEKENVVSFIDF